MSCHEFHHRAYREMREPGPGSFAAGYVCYAVHLEVPASFVEQKQRITEFAAKKGWKIVRWYEEPGQNAVNEGVEQRPVLAQLLHDAEDEFQVVLCLASPYWSRHTSVAYSLFEQLQRLGVLWATADGRWDTNKVWQEGTDMTCILPFPSKRTSRRSKSKKSQKRQKGEN